MNRAGAIFVAVQVQAIIVEFRRRSRLQILFYRKLLTIISSLKEKDDEDARELRALKFLEGEIRKAESHVLFMVVLLAMVGELLHGFGDMLMEAFIH